MGSSWRERELGKDFLERKNRKAGLDGKIGSNLKEGT